MKQTAVEWLENQIEENALIKPFRELGFNIFIKQAKEIEKINTDNKVIHFAE